MSNREKVIELVNAMPEYRIVDLLAFLQASEDIPNDESIQAIEDVRNRQNLIRPFNSVDDLMEALNAED